MRLIKLVLLVLALFVAPNAAIAQKRVALTFDDVPRSAGAFLSHEERTAKIIAALKHAGVNQAAFFLNPGKLVEPDRTGGEARIAAYVSAGHVIANHSNTHPALTSVTAEAYLADIDAASAWLKGRPGYRPWFRFPYLNEGRRDKVKRDAIRAGLKARGLMNGYVTADGSDWHLEQLAIDAKVAGKAMDMNQLKKLYIASQISALEYHDQLAKDTIKRSPAHVLLLHETDLAALFLADLVAEMRLAGWEVITADQAYKDPIAKVMPDVPYAYGTLIGSMAWEKDVKPRAYPFWMDTSVISAVFKERVLKEMDGK
jgi:peptidoglycan/xylan/chitin deacetylase (PgdA/CDA1 family)